MSRFESHDLVLDGRHLLCRTSDAFRQLTAKVDGEEIATGGIYGFLAGAIRVKKAYGGQVRVAWEGKDNFRHKLFPGYKKRERTEEEMLWRESLEEQEGRLGEILEACGVEQIRGVRCEADDVIGTIAAANRYKGRNTIMYSGDSDLRQLVRDERPGLGWIKAVQPLPRRDVVYDEAKVLERDGVRPCQVAHLKAIAGDTSDKIPGAPGLGPKAAIAILDQFGTLDRAILASGIPEGWCGTAKQKEKFTAAIPDMQLYLKLTKIRVKVKLHSRPGERDLRRLSELLKRYRFASLASPFERRTLLGLAVEK